MTSGHFGALTACGVNAFGDLFISSRAESQVTVNKKVYNSKRKSLKKSQINRAIRA